MRLLLQPQLCHQLHLLRLVKKKEAYYEHLLRECRSFSQRPKGDGKAGMWLHITQSSKIIMTTMLTSDEQVREGRLSFPSGHASLACFGATFAILYFQVLLSKYKTMIFLAPLHRVLVESLITFFPTRCGLRTVFPTFLELPSSSYLSSMPSSAASLGHSSS